MKGGAKVIIEPHRHQGRFLSIAFSRAVHKLVYMWQIIFLNKQEFISDDIIKLFLEFLYSDCME